MDSRSDTHTGGSPSGVRFTPDRRAVALTVVVATYNRFASLDRLLTHLANQTLAPDTFEVIVVDDGSPAPVAPLLTGRTFPFSLRIVTQPNRGAATARHNGIERAAGDILVIVDDDMELPDVFLAEHLRLQLTEPRLVVIGRIRPYPAIRTKPLFERFNAAMLDRFAEEVRAGRRFVDGTRLFTGNVSMRRSDYLTVGGFDRALGHSEDVELGVRLQKSGVRFSYSEAAYTIHCSDHTSEDSWRRRAELYGVFDSRIAERHREAFISPWRVLYEAHPCSQPFLALGVLVPPVARVVARAGMLVAKMMDALGAERAAIAGTTVVYSMLYFCGVRRDAGSLRAAWTDLVAYLAERKRSAPGSFAGQLAT